VTDRSAPREREPARNAEMTSAPSAPGRLGGLDTESRALVRLAAAIAARDERTMRGSMSEAALVVPRAWVEELVLQSYLFAGFPRALNAAREWRRIAGPVDSEPDEAERPSSAAGELTTRGEATCRAVYGAAYERLRRNIRALHPALDEWMITEGYGKVLSRPGLDLPRRELCVIAACAAAGQERQLHAHLHGAVNVGAPRAWVSDALDALEGVVEPAALDAARMLWARVRGK
jgi:4-carboxymuconolactone decarboxylase